MNSPEIEFPTPAREQDKNYLGLSGTGNLNIGQIKTQVLIVEVNNLYCLHCQRAASRLNDLFWLIQGKPVLKEKIKMIGGST